MVRGGGMSMNFWREKITNIDLSILPSTNNFFGVGQNKLLKKYEIHFLLQTNSLLSTRNYFLRIIYYDYFSKDDVNFNPNKKTVTFIYDKSKMHKPLCRIYTQSAQYHFIVEYFRPARGRVADQSISDHLSLENKRDH